MTIPSGIRKVILPLAMLFVFGATWFGLYKPELALISEYKQQPAANKDKIEQLVRQLSEYDPPTNEEREQWSDLEERINMKLPPGKQITGLYSLLSGLAEQHGCQDFTRQELAGSDTTYTSHAIPRRGFDIQLNFSCEYKGLKGYIEGLKKADRLVELVGLQINRSLPLISVQMVIRSYYLS